MLHVYTFFKDFSQFRSDMVDLSMVPTSDLADQCEVLLNHHSDCKVFLGYLEPGWMLELCDQTRLRKLFRKFPVAVISFFPESLPYSWKTDIEILYTQKPNGETNAIDDGSFVQHKPKDGHNKASRKSSAK